jgi:hypothetical protein
MCEPSGACQLPSANFNSNLSELGSLRCRDYPGLDRQHLKPAFDQCVAAAKRAIWFNAYSSVHIGIIAASAPAMKY